MECFEKGLIEADRTEGIDLSWGNGDALPPLLRKMAYREGWLGSLLADGTRKAANQLGAGSEDFAVHCKGLELPMHDPKAFSGWTLAYGTTNRGACHLSATTYNIERGMTLPDIGLEQPLDRFSSEGKAAMVKTYHAFSAILESLVACKFMVYTGLTLSDFQSVLNPATGVKRSIEDLMICGQRIYHLGRLINHACGLTGENDRMPKRILGEPYEEGNAAGFVPDYPAMLKEYYELQEWDERGIPTHKRIRDLGLDEFESFLNV
jgi:aldehyde:ferredoxin oxidoreductase